MPAIDADPERAREFARVVVHRLRGGGHEALWAGGCVRDELLGRTPADYDVATSALPEQVRAIFGRSRTIAVGAAFGVITVVGPKDSGQVEVTTFRTDAAYTDGRHPDGVRFSTAREDAQRRDFTINGLFLDPVDGTVHDHVGGRADLEAGIVRAIGLPAERFSEDHLRMLRAVRFAAGFAFVLESGTLEAIHRLAPLVATVSPERIAAELRVMVSRPGRGRALWLLRDTGLARVVLPEVAPAADDGADDARWDDAARTIEALDAPTLPLVLAILAERTPSALPRIASRLRLSNREAEAAAWARSALDAFVGRNPHPAERPWSSVQPWLAHRDAPLLADALQAHATVAVGDDPASAALSEWVAGRMSLPRARLDPPPLLGGHDLLRAGVPAGPGLGTMLERIRTLQLDGQLSTAAEELRWVESTVAGGG